MKEFNVKEIMDKEVDMNSYIQKLVNEIREDKDVYESIKTLNLTIKEVRDNISKFKDYKDDFNYCKNCQGLDKCLKTTPHTKMSIAKEGNFISTNYEPCEKLLEQIKNDSKYLIKDFPSEWKNSSIKNLDLSSVRKPLIKEFAKILKGESERWLFVNGNHRVGKSYILVTFANEFVNLGLGQVAILNCPQRIKDIADVSYLDKEEFSKEISLLAKVPLLVLEDFGEEYKNEYIRDQIILPILSERERNSLLTFFSSDFSIDEIKEMYSIGKNGGEIRAKQLAKILKEMCVEEYDISGVSVYKK